MQSPILHHHRCPSRSALTNPTPSPLLLFNNSNRISPYNRAPPSMYQPQHTYQSNTTACWSILHHHNDFVLTFVNNVLPLLSYITLQCYSTNDVLVAANWPILHHPTILLHHWCPSRSALTNPTPLKSEGGAFVGWLLGQRLGKPFGEKLDVVGPVDNRPSTDKLHHFVKKLKTKQKNVTSDTWHVTCDMCHVTCDTWHMTFDVWHMTHEMWHIVEGEHSLKISAP